MANFVKAALYLALIGAPVVSSMPAFELEEREAGCIALCGQCPCPVGGGPSSPAPSTTPPPSATVAAAPTSFGCFHGADPDGALGICPAVAATGWCVCSDLSTYAIETGSNPCGYTAPPPQGPTVLPTTSCSVTAATASATGGLVAPDVEGTPIDEKSCPAPTSDNTFVHFTAAYIKQNIVDMLIFQGGTSKKKGSYPKAFNPNSPKAPQFDWSLNNCGTRQTAGETILELPMFVDSGMNEVSWSSTPVGAGPGPYREYYILKDGTATYCGAYAHADDQSNGDFKACT